MGEKKEIGEGETYGIKKKKTKNFETNQPIARYPDLNKLTVRENVTTNEIFDDTKKLFLTFPV